MEKKKKLCEKCEYNWYYQACGWREFGCQYILITGEPRGCKCDNNCEKFKKRKGNRKNKLY